jgi:hypothetical protein
MEETNKMLQIIHSVEKVGIKEWTDFVNNHPDGTAFQLPDMYQLFIKAKNFEPVFIAALESGTVKGILLAVIIKEYPGKIGFFSSRTVVYGGPLVSDNPGEVDEILDQLLKALILKVKNKSIFIQFRNFKDWTSSLSVFEKNGFKFLDRLNYIVDTSSEEVIKKNISSSKLRQIKKGIKLGAEIIDPENLEQLRAFYDILHQLYKYKVKKPLPRWSFFKAFYELSQSNKLGIIKLVKYQNRIVGGILSPVIDGKVIYEWYVCGLDVEFRNIYPSVLATWAAIDYAHKNNILFFDFMGVGVPGKDYGVREFKSRFGGELVNFGRFGRINNKFLYGITEVGFNLLALMKKI